MEANCNWCNRLIPVESEVCPKCKTDLDKGFIKCPECNAIIHGKPSQCSKCGRSFSWPPVTLEELNKQLDTPLLDTPGIFAPPSLSHDVKALYRIVTDILSLLEKEMSTTQELENRLTKLEQRIKELEESK